MECSTNIKIKKGRTYYKNRTIKQSNLYDNNNNTDKKYQKKLARQSSAAVRANRRGQWCFGFQISWPGTGCTFYINPLLDNPRANAALKIHYLEKEKGTLICWANMRRFFMVGIYFIYLF